MSNIQSARNIKPPTLQTSSKQDGGGNGSGGMYFGQGQEEEQQQNPVFQFDFPEDEYASGAPYTAPPLTSPPPSAMATWKAALAKNLYEAIHRANQSPH